MNDRALALLVCLLLHGYAAGAERAVDTCVFDASVYQNGAQSACVPTNTMNAFLHKTLATVYAKSNAADPPTRFVFRDKLTPRAKKAAAALDFRKALPLFRAAYFFQPYREDIVINLAEALYEYALAIIADKSVHDLPKTRQKEVWRLLCEALAGAELATYIQNKPLAHLSVQNDSGLSYIASTGLALATAAALDRFFPGRCHSTGNCEAYKRGKDAMRLELETPSPRKKQHLEAVNTMCLNEDSVRVDFSGAGRRRGVPSITFGRSLFISMRICGVVRIPKLFDSATLDPIRKAQQGLLSNFLMKMKEAKGPTSGVDIGAGINAYMGGMERATVSPGRYEIKLPAKSPFTSPGFSDNHFLLHAMKLAMLGERLLIDTFSFIASVAGAPDQDWHVDVTGPFTERGNTYSHLPPQGIVSVVPFDDMDSITGPTEHLFGSHVAFEGDYWQRMAMQQERDVVSARVQGHVGDALLFDSRLVHRGTANKARRSRSIAYVLYSRGFWVDDVNFKKPHTKRWGSLGSHTRRALFRRLDQQEYSSRVEMLLADAVGEETAKKLLEGIRWRGEEHQMFLGKLV